MNKSELSRAIGKAPKGIDDWIARGLPYSKDGGRYCFDMVAVFVWREADRSKDKTKSTSKDSDKKKKVDEQTRLITEQADKLEMENALRRGELGDLNIITLVWQRALMALRTRLLSLPSRYAAQVFQAKTRAEVSEIIKQGLYEALEELSSGEIEPDSPLEDDKPSADSTPTTAKTDSKRVGRRGKKAKQRVKRGARKVENK